MARRNAACAARCATSSSKGRRQTTSSACRTARRSSRAAHHARSRCSPARASIAHWPAKAGSSFQALAHADASPTTHLAFRAARVSGRRLHLPEPAAADDGGRGLQLLAHRKLRAFRRLESRQLPHAVHRARLSRLSAPLDLRRRGRHTRLSRLCVASRLLHREIRRTLPPAAGFAPRGPVLHRCDPAHHRSAGAARAGRAHQHVARTSSACRLSRRSCTPSSPR